MLTKANTLIQGIFILLIQLKRISSLNESSIWSSMSDEVAIASNQWTDIATSSTGSIIYSLSAIQGLYRSKNFGESWSIISITTTNSNPTWSVIACSSDAKYVTVAYQGAPVQILVSSDNGESWTAAFSSTVSARYFAEISMTGSGQYQAAIQNQYITSSAYMSSNYGSTWVYNAYSTTVSLTTLYSSVTFVKLEHL